MLGNGRLEALCFDGEKRLAHIRGKLRKKVWINQGDIILLSLRDYQDEKGDVIMKYSADEARSLKAYGELPENAKINETDTFVSPFTNEERIQANSVNRATRPRTAGSSSATTTRRATTKSISTTSKLTFNDSSFARLAVGVICLCNGTHCWAVSGYSGQALNQYQIPHTINFGSLTSACYSVAQGFITELFATCSSLRWNYKPSLGWLKPEVNDIVRNSLRSLLSRLSCSSLALNVNCQSQPFSYLR